MEKWLFIVETNCNDAAREAEFNDWYDNIHLPDVMETAGVIKATRYQNDEPAAGKGKFLAAYEIETDDIDQARKALGENVAKKREQGRMSDLLVVTSRSTYKQISSRG